MFDRQMAQAALGRMSPAMRDLAEASAKARGMSACDVVLEQGLTIAQAQSSEALYALKEKGSRPALRAIK